VVYPADDLRRRADNTHETHDTHQLAGESGESGECSCPDELDPPHTD